MRGQLGSWEHVIIHLYKPQSENKNAKISIFSVIMEKLVGTFFLTLSYLRANLTFSSQQVVSLWGGGGVRQHCLFTFCFAPASPSDLKDIRSLFSVLFFFLSFSDSSVGKQTVYKQSELTTSFSADQIVAKVKPFSGLRVGVLVSGCSGMEMDLYFEKDYFYTRSSVYTKIHIPSDWKVWKHELDLLERLFGH